MATYSISPEEPGRGPSPDAAARYQLEERTKSGAHWFYWIAALSLITSIVALSGSNWGFFASLGMTRIVDAIAAQVAHNTGSAVKIIAFVFDLVAIGIFAGLGYLASKRLTWAFVVGMVLYLLDSVILIVVGEGSSVWLSVAFHAFVLYSVFGGYKACTQLAALDREATLAPPPPYAPGNTP
jgi:hypothetical protein